MDQENLLWLRGRVAATKQRSVSEALDQIVRAARLTGHGKDEDIRSVVGTIDIDDKDPLLSGADEYVRALFDQSAARPWLVRVAPPASRPRRKGPRRG